MQKTESGFTVRDFRAAVEELWPAHTAEAWDRVGLIVGSDEQPVQSVLLAVDAVAATVEEAKNKGADLLFTHHPYLLRGIHSIAEDTSKGSLLATAVRSNLALFAAHTNADVAAAGVSDAIANGLGLEELRPLVPSSDAEGALQGLGRVGNLSSPVTLREFAERLAKLMPPTVSGVRVSGDAHQMVSRVALCGGAGDSLLDNPCVRSADVYVTSDLRHHPAQEFREQQLLGRATALVDVSHWAAESLWLETAAQQLSERLPGVAFSVSRQNTDAWNFAIGANASVDSKG